MYHMWYLRMLIGIYALTPFIIRFKESITEKMFYKVSFVFLILVSVGYWRTGIAQSFEFLGYYMIGFSIRRIFGNRNNTGKALVLILTGIILEICVAGFLYKQMIEGNDNLGRIVTPYAPLIVLASICIFAGFTMLSIKMELKDIANITFYIYLIHAGVWGLIEKIFMITLGADILTRLNGGIWVPLFVVVVFGISYVLSKLYLWIWDKLDKKARITNYLLKIVRLQTD